MEYPIILVLLALIAVCIIALIWVSPTNSDCANEEPISPKREPLRKKEESKKGGNEQKFIERKVCEVGRDESDEVEEGIDEDENDDDGEEEESRREEGDEDEEEDEEDEEESEDEEEGDGDEEDDDESEEDTSDEEDEEYDEEDGASVSPKGVIYPLDYVSGLERFEQWQRDHPLLNLAAGMIAAWVTTSPEYQRRQAQARRARFLAELREAEEDGENVCLKCETRDPPRCDEGHCQNCTRKCDQGHCQKCRSCNFCPYCGCGGGDTCGCDD